MAFRRKNNLIKQTLILWLSQLQTYKWLVIASMFCKFMANITSNILLPIIIGRILNHLVLADTVDTVYINSQIYLIIGLLICSIIFEYFWNLLGSIYMGKTKRDLELFIFNKLLYKSYSFYSGVFGSSLTSQFNRFIHAFQYFHDSVFRELYSILINFSASLIVTLFISPIIGVVMVIWTILYVLIITRITRKRFENKQAGSRGHSKVTGYLSDVLGNIITIKIFAREKHEVRKYENIINSKMSEAQKTALWSINTAAVIGLMMAILNVTVLMMSTYFITIDKMGIGTLVLIQAFIVRLSVQLWKLGTIIRDLDKSFAESGEMIGILNNEPDLIDPESPKKTVIKNGAIELKNVCFEYPDKDSIPKLFDKLNFKISPGEKVGIVGPSGSGKTTIFRILLRLADINAGEILIDGHNITEMRHEDIRKSISYVPQEPILFHRTILENIKYGNPNASQVEVSKAVKKSRSHIFINRLPNGYDTMVGERGFKLSTGQRQRLAIARAMLKPSPILILDEATSAIDSESENLIQSSLDELMRTRTTIVIAHRLSTIEKMDRIIYMSYGKIIEQGSHKELLKRNGPYAKLWSHQTGKYLEN